MRIFTAPCNLTLDDGTVIPFAKGEAVPVGVQSHWYVQAHSEKASPVFVPAEVVVQPEEVDPAGAVDEVAAEVVEAASAGEEAAEATAAAEVAEAEVVADAPAGDTAAAKTKRK